MRGNSDCGGREHHTVGAEEVEASHIDGCVTFFVSFSSFVEEDLVRDSLLCFFDAMTILITFLGRITSS